MRIALALGGLNGLCAVALGAYAAHGMADAHAADIARQASTYQLVHALLLVAIGGYGERRPSALLGAAALLVVVGILLFCGALYAVALSGVRAGPAAPVGGISLMLGWLMVFVAALRR
jgi:uncharacterized membrane protein YgdD (TMEM256/DUF423 family)